MAGIVHDIDDWLEKNRKFFQPPICNKLMYKDGQLKTFFVGGPNSRKDFHMEAGEEFFYMLKGDMRLVVYEKGNFKDIAIKEGDVFLLPRGIPHSPQRQADTIGLVIERERKAAEMDCLRYYVDGSHEILYEKWFHCDSLEELGPLIKEFFGSEQYRTGKPVPGTVPEDKPVEQDHQRTLMDPFSLKSWISQNTLPLQSFGKKALFDGDCVSRIWVLAEGCHETDPDLPETFFWQLEGECEIETEEATFKLTRNQTLLLNGNKRFVLRNSENSFTVTVAMDPLDS